MPKFSDVAEMLKKRYDHFAVQVEMDVNPPRQLILLFKNGSLGGKKS